MGCGGILSVGDSSASPSRLVKLTWAPKGAKAHLALVGKGVTFDSGGLTIKPASSMTNMKGDMAGAASVIAATFAIARLGLPIRVTAFAPMAENMVSSTSTRPGDVVTMHNGTNRRDRQHRRRGPDAARRRARAWPCRRSPTSSSTSPP